VSLLKFATGYEIAESEYPGIKNKPELLLSQPAVVRVLSEGDTISNHHALVSLYRAQTGYLLVKINMFSGKEF